MQVTKLMVALGLTAGIAACGDSKKKGGGGNGNANSAELTAALDCSVEKPDVKQNGEDAEKNSGKAKSKGKSKGTSKAKNQSNDDENLELRGSDVRKVAEDDEENDEDTEDEDVSDTDDEDKDAADSEYKPEPRHVPADALIFARKSNTDTMCDVLRGKDQKLAIFSFFSLDCSSCRDRAEEIASGVADLGLEDKVLPVVVVTDPKDALAADEWRDIQDDVAASAVWGFDSTGEIWRFFGGAKQTAKKIRPWVLLMDQYATGILDKDPEHDVPALLEIVKQWLNLEISASGTDHGGQGSTSTRTSTATAPSTSTATASATQTSTQAATSTRTAAVTATATGTGTVTAVAPTAAPSP